MKIYDIQNTNEKLYYEKLDNNLEVFIVPKSNVKEYYISFVTKYGGVNNTFYSIKQEKKIDVPTGIAHFLEHKMFEQEDKIDPFSFYSKTGTYCNAYTSFYETNYIVSGNSNIKKNLNFLLDYVQKPYFTKENVEKEKGIIEQELLMYEDIPEMVVFEKNMYNIFEKDPLKYSIGGRTEDIKTITKEMLDECYFNFYNPNNMFVVITGKVDPIKTIEIIKENQNKKHFENIEIKKLDVIEPNKVIKDHEEIKMNLEIPIFSIGFKVPLKNKLSQKNRLYYSLLFNSLFDDTSLFVEKLKEEKLIATDLDFSYIDGNQHLVLIIETKTNNYEKLKQEIINYISNINIDEEVFDRKKKVYLSNYVTTFDSVKAINKNIVNSIIRHNNFNTDFYELIKSTEYKDFEKFAKSVNFANFSSVIVN